MQKIKSHIKDQCDLILRQFNEPQLFISAGPGHVNSEVYYLNQFWTNATFWGFEPSIHRYNQLKDFGFPGTLFNEALLSINGYLDGNVEKAGGCFVKSLATNRNQEEFNKLTISCNTLDTLVSDNVNSVFLWADVEGAEFDILQGAENLIKEKRIIGINLELTDKKRAKRTGWPETEKIERYLEGFNYYRIRAKFKNQDILYAPVYN